MNNPSNEWTDAHVDQGFSWRPGSVAFRKLNEGGMYDVGVKLEELEYAPSADAIRVIDAI